MFRKIILIVAVIGLSACSDPNGARKTLKDMNMHDIKTDGWTFFSGCPNDDNWVTTFTAKNAANHTVTGVVCGSLWSNHVRFD